MAYRPAGMSDDDSENEFKPSFYDKPEKSSDIRPVQNGSSVSNLSPSIDEQRLEKQELEFRALSASMSGNVEVIKEYIKDGHNVNDYLHTGWTLLLYGAAAVAPEVVELLVKSGADPNKSKDGTTPLMEVCLSTKGSQERCLHCISILLEAKADPNARSKSMKTALMMACQSRGVEVVEELLKYVKKINATDNEGRTALHYAALANKAETVEILLKNKASITIKDRNDLSARDIAEIKGYEKIVALLAFEENGYTEEYCELTSSKTWNDMFPAIASDTTSMLNADIANMLYGMGLESYNALFKGMSLNTFLKLTEEDLLDLGMDISLHRKQFADNLHKFHVKAWSMQSIGSIDKYLPYTLYDGVALLGKAARQIGVIGSSFKFIKTGLGKAKAKGVELSDVQKNEYKEELRKTEETLVLIKNDIGQIMNLAKKVEKKNRGIEPAAYIGRKMTKYNWTIIVSVALMTGMYLSKRSFVQRLWNH